MWSLFSCCCFFAFQARLPSNTGAHRPKTSQERDRRSVWVALHWLAEDQILTSGLGGELITWDVSTLTSIAFITYSDLQILLLRRSPQKIRKKDTVNLMRDPLG